MQSPQPPERPFSGSVSFVVLPVRDGRRRRVHPDSRPAHRPDEHV